MRYQSETFPIKMLITQEFNMKCFNKPTPKTRKYEEINDNILIRKLC